MTILQRFPFMAVAFCLAVVGPAGAATASSEPGTHGGHGKDRFWVSATTSTAARRHAASAPNNNTGVGGGGPASGTSGISSGTGDSLSPRPTRLHILPLL